MKGLKFLRLILLMMIVILIVSVIYILCKISLYAKFLKEKNAKIVIKCKSFIDWFSINPDKYELYKDYTIYKINITGENSEQEYINLINKYPELKQYVDYSKTYSISLENLINRINRKNNNEYYIRIPIGFTNIIEKSKYNKFYKSIKNGKNQFQYNQIMKAFLENIQKDINIKRKMLDDTMNSELDKIKEIHLRLTENK